MKATKQQAVYISHSKIHHCDGCEHWRTGTCTEVQGAIAADGTCEYYQKKGPMGKLKK